MYGYKVCYGKSTQGMELTLLRIVLEMYSLHLEGVRKGMYNIICTKYNMRRLVQEIYSASSSGVKKDSNRTI